jgi:hypothetical protein
VFKQLKSLFHYNEIPSKLEDTACAWFYRKLLLAALRETIVNKGRFPPWAEQQTGKRMELVEGTGSEFDTGG